jgi:Tol biopolymer transport system component
MSKRGIKHALLAIWVVFSFLLTVSLSERLDTGKIVFVSDRDGNKNIYVMDTDGSNIKQLTDDPAREWNPVWSPDGTKIAFVSDREMGSNIYVMDADGSNIKQLTYGFAEDLNPTWCPDGGKIAFNSDRDGSPQIYVMNADGSNVKQLTDDKEWNATPAWSPDGTKIAYACTSISELFTTGSVVSKIRVVHSDGGNIKELTGENDFNPVWSPDGTKIAFNSNRDGNFEIYVMNSDGSQQKRVTYHSGKDNMASWSLNGEKIVFVSDRDGDKEIYMMDVDSERIVQITKNSFQDDEPDWHKNVLISYTEYVPTEPAERPDEYRLHPVQVVVPPHSEKVGITGIGISYELHGTHGDHWKYWIGKHDDGNYYVDMASCIFSATSSQGQKVDMKYIQKLAESFTDFYETEKILRFEGVRFDGSVNFEVLVKLENGKTLSMNTPFDYERCCFIPWSIVYSNKKYMQSNGKITHAVLGLLNELDDDGELQIVYDKEISWGCYPAELHFEYCDEELSADFPHSVSAPSVLEELGEKQVAWEVDIPGIVCPAAFGDGKIYVATTESVMAIDAETRKIVWETGVELAGGGQGVIVLDGKMVYAGVSSRIYGFNAETGEVVWKFSSIDSDAIQIIPVNDKLIVWEKTGWVEGKISCLTAQSGNVIWEIPEEVGFLEVVDDAVLYKIEKDWEDYEYLYELVDITSGKKIWQKGSSRYVHWDSDIVNWSFYEGILYINKEDEGTVVSVDMETMEERVIYSHRKFKTQFDPGEIVQYCQVFEEGILLSIIEFGEIELPFKRWDTRIVFLDRNGNEIWEHRYDEKSVGSLYFVMESFLGRYVYNPVVSAKVSGDTLLLVRENGFLETFHAKNREKLWESKVRDSINRVFIGDNRVYVAAQDCKLYCLDIGGIVWELKACDNFCIVCVDADSERFHALTNISCRCDHLIDAVWIGDEILLVTTEDKLIGVFTGNNHQFCISNPSFENYHLFSLLEHHLLSFMGRNMGVVFI